MKKQKYKVLGVMSGTSLDGIDCAVVEFYFEQNRWQYKLVFGQTVTYTDQWIKRLFNAMNLNDRDLHLLNIDYTSFLADQLNDFIEEHQFTDLDFIASHGHTVLHQPADGLTLQIGNLPLMADLFDIPFVCDFRVQDVALGGQGAPLVPIGDRLLFGEYDYCLNLGGFSNISYEFDKQRIAFDICPVNTLLNHFAQKEGLPFDEDGKLAQQDTVNKNLLAALNNLGFYQESHPKSLGMEQVNTIYLPLIQSFGCANLAILATLTEHIAYQIAQVVDKKGRLLVTGGGAFNSFLIARMQHYLPNIDVVIGDPALTDFKEAIIFAFLGVLRIENINNVLSSVTGAKHDHCAGVVFGG